MRDLVLTRGMRLERHHHDLYRQAYLLVGEPDRAVRLTERALAQCRSTDSADDESARTALVRSVIADSVRVPVSDHPDVPGWQALGRLSARRRAAIVLRFDEGLTEEHTAARLGTSRQSVRADIDAALLTLRMTIHGAEDPWLVVTDALSVAGQRWSAAAGAPVPASSGPHRPVPADGPPRAASWRATAAPWERRSDAQLTGRTAPPAARPAGGFDSFGRPLPSGRDPEPLGLPIVTGPRPESGLLAAGPVAPASTGPRRRRPAWPVLTVAAVTTLVVLGAVLIVPVLRADKPTPPPAAASAVLNVPLAKVPDRVPSRPVPRGLLDWPARGPLARDTGVEARAAAAWRTTVTGAEKPANGMTLLWAGKLDGRRTAVLQAISRRGEPRLAQVVETEGAFRLLMAEPLMGTPAALSLLPAVGKAGPVRVLVSPEAQAAEGLLAVDPMSGQPLRRFPVDAGGLSGVLPSPPGSPTCSRVLVLGLGTLTGRVGSGPRVLQSNIMTAEMMVGMSDPKHPVEMGSAALAPAEGAVPDMTWFHDGETLLKKVPGAGILTVAALGPRIAPRRLSGTDPRIVHSRAYELRKGGKTYLGSVVELNGKQICASAWPVGRPERAAFVLRCPIMGSPAGLVHVVAVADVNTVSVALQPTPAPPGQRAWSGSMTRPAPQQSTSAFAALTFVPSGFPCGPGTVQAGGDSRGLRTMAVPVYIP